MNITITLTADNNFLTAVNALTAALTGKTTGIAPAAEETPKKESPAAETSKANEEPKASGASESINGAVNGKANGQLTLETIRALVREKSKVEATKKKIKGILGEFGAENVSSLQKEQYTDFYTKVEAL